MAVFFDNLGTETLLLFGLLTPIMQVWEPMRCRNYNT